MIIEILVVIVMKRHKISVDLSFNKLAYNVVIFGETAKLNKVTVTIEMSSDVS